MRYTLATIVCSSALAVAAVACGNLGFDAASERPWGPGGGYSQGGYGGSETIGPGGAGGGPQQFDYSEFCGGGCVPMTNMLNECLPDEGGAGGAGGSGGSTTGAGGGGGGGMGGAGGAEIPEGDCKLGVDDFGDVSGVCSATLVDVTAGTPCMSSAECGPGQGCVAAEPQDSAKQCLPYCCGDVEACPSEPAQYCALLPMALADVPSGQSAPLIPVCVRAVACELLNENSCEAGKACTIVRIDGTVSCVAIEPDAGGAGSQCPCLEGHFCNTQSNTCLKLCKTDGSDDCPTGETCSGGGTIYPPGFGACTPQN